MSWWRREFEEDFNGDEARPVFEDGHYICLDCLDHLKTKGCYCPRCARRRREERAVAPEATPETQDG